MQAEEENRNRLSAVLVSRLNHVGIYQRVVERDPGVRGCNIADATHVGGKVINLIDTSGRLHTVLTVAQVELEKLVGSPRARTQGA